MSILEKPIILKTNRFWMALRPETPQKVFVDMAKGTVRALDFVYFENPDGSFDTENPIDIRPVTWEEWIQLPVRTCDLSVGLSQDRRIRIPTVVVCTEYGKTPMKRLRLTPTNVYARDNGMCQYSGRKLRKGEATMDHIQPRSKGGKTEWTNIVLCAKDINLGKGNKSNEEAGLKLLRKPKAPSPIPASATITEQTIAHPDWKHFVVKK